MDTMTENYNRVLISTRELDYELHFHLKLRKHYFSLVSQSCFKLELSTDAVDGPIHLQESSQVLVNTRSLL